MADIDLFPLGVQVIVVEVTPSRIIAVMWSPDGNRTLGWVGVVADLEIGNIMDWSRSPNGDPSAPLVGYALEIVSESRLGASSRGVACRLVAGSDWVMSARLQQRMLSQSVMQTHGLKAKMSPSLNLTMEDRQRVTIKFN